MKVTFFNSPLTLIYNWKFELYSNGGGNCNWKKIKHSLILFNYNVGFFSHYTRGKGELIFVLHLKNLPFLILWQKGERKTRNNLLFFVFETIKSEILIFLFKTLYILSIFIYSFYLIFVCFVSLLLKPPGGI